MEEISLDLKARRVLMSSMLYYGLGVNILSDREFDTYCRELSERWGELSPERRACLGNKNDVKDTGYHFKITSACMHGACSWMEKVRIYNPEKCRPYMTRPQRRLRGIGHWLYPHEFGWELLPRNEENLITPIGGPIL